MPDFNTKPAKEKRPAAVCLLRYELLGANDRITMAVHGDTSIQAKFHNFEFQLISHPHLVPLTSVFILQFTQQIIQLLNVGMIMSKLHAVTCTTLKYNI